MFLKHRFAILQSTQFSCLCTRSPSCLLAQFEFMSCTFDSKHVFSIAYVFLLFSIAVYLLSGSISEKESESEWVVGCEVTSEKSSRS